MKTGFILYVDSKAVFDSMPNEKAGELIKAIFEYEVNKKEPDISSDLRYIFVSIKQYLDKNSEKHAVVSETRRNTGRLGGLAKARKSKQLLDDDSKSSKVKQSVHDIDIDIDIDIENDIDNNKEKGKRKNFIPPTLSQVKEHMIIYSKEKNMQIDVDIEAEKCFLHYKGAEWTRGKAKIKISNWKSVVSGWVLRSMEYSGNTKNRNAKKTDAELMAEARARRLLEDG